jgi:hypothetical protein
MKEKNENVVGVWDVSVDNECHVPSVAESELLDVESLC